MEENNKKGIDILRKTNEYIDKIDEKAKKLGNNTLVKHYDLFHQFASKSRIAERIRESEIKGNITYIEMFDILQNIEDIGEYAKELKESIELEKFLKNKVALDLKKLKKKYGLKKVKSKFPGFNWESFQELVNNPPLEYTNFAGEVIKFDPFLVKKFIFVIAQMIFDEMDVLIVSCGQEGSGKSCFTSQMILWFYNTLSKLNLINYDYDMKQIYFSSLEYFMDFIQGLKVDDYFRILNLDEGSELNRNNYREEKSIQFRDEMRVDRKNHRIKFINLPALGELDPSITLDRANFIFNCDMKSDNITGTLQKGNVDMYIMPRSRQIFSTKHRRNIDKYEIKNAFSKMLNSKTSYYSGLPEEVMINSFSFENKWGFNKNKYDEYIKEQNREKRLGKSIKLTNKVAYVLDQKVPPMHLWNFDTSIKSEKTQYDLIRKFFNKINVFFRNKEDLKEQIRKSYEYRDKIEKK